MNRGPYYNKEGYPDPTAYQAVKTVTKEEQAAAEEKQRVTRLMYAVNAVVELAGFKLVNRLELEDAKTGKIYR